MTTCCTTCYTTRAMLKSYVYIPEELNRKIKTTAKLQKKSKAQVIREALEKGVSSIARERGASAEALLKLAKLGEKYAVAGPKDLSANLDKYVWGGKE